MQKLSKKTRLATIVGLSLGLVFFGYNYWFVSASNMDCSDVGQVSVRNRLDHKRTQVVQSETCRFLPRIWEEYTPEGQIQSQPCGCALDGSVEQKS
jgi:hypothetical protein